MIYVMRSAGFDKNNNFMAPHYYIDTNSLYMYEYL